MPSMDQLRVEPTAQGQSVGRVRASPTRHEPVVQLTGAGPLPVGAVEPGAAVSAEGSMRAAYTQFLVDPATNRIRVRIRDAVTDEVIREIPAEEVERVAASLRAYSETLARRRAIARIMEAAAE